MGAPESHVDRERCESKIRRIFESRKMDPESHDSRKIPGHMRKIFWESSPIFRTSSGNPVQSLDPGTQIRSSISRISNILFREPKSDRRSLCLAVHSNYWHWWCLAWKQLHCSYSGILEHFWGKRTSVSTSINTGNKATSTTMLAHN